MGGLTLPVLHTERLTLEPVSAQHLPLLVRLNRDPDVMRFIAGRPATEDETAEEWDRRLGPRSDAARGLGYWAGFRAAASGVEFVGWWGLGATSGDDLAANLGYRLPRAAWGHGLATEGARALAAHAFTDLGLRLVWATTMAVNTGSRGVLSKLGMRHTSTDLTPWAERIPGWEDGEVRYEITRDEWVQQPRELGSP